MNRVISRVVLGGLLIILANRQLVAQTLSDSAEISVLTYTPSRELYAAFGHSALRVRDPATNYDVVYNCGSPLTIP